MKGSSAFLPIGEFNARQALSTHAAADKQVSEKSRTTTATATSSSSVSSSDATYSSSSSSEPSSEGASSPSQRHRGKRQRDDGFEEYPCSSIEGMSPSTSSSLSSCADVLPRLGLDVFRLSCQATMDHRTILKTLVEKEKTQMPDPHYMTTVQRSLKPRMTAVLAEWLADVCSEECLIFSRNTLDAAIRNVELYLSKYPITSSQYQLLGAASLLIAYKFNERHQENIVNLLVEFGGDAYDRSQLIMMERQLASALEWNLLPVTGHEILEILVDAEHKDIANNYIDGDTEPLVKRRRCELQTSAYTKTDAKAWCMMQDVLYVSESNYCFLKFPPSVQAAAAYCVAKRNQTESQDAFVQAVAVTKDLLGVRTADINAFIRMLKTVGEMQEKTRSATPQSVVAEGTSGDVFD